MEDRVVDTFYCRSRTTGEGRWGCLTPLEPPEALSLLNPSNFVPKDGSPIVKGLSGGPAGEGGAYPFVSWLSHLTIDYAYLSRSSTAILLVDHVIIGTPPTFGR